MLSGLLNTGIFHAKTQKGRIEVYKTLLKVNCQHHNPSPVISHSQDSDLVVLSNAS